MVNGYANCTPPHASMSVDIGYILGYQDEYEELRYSLRSLKFFPHGEVWIAGAPPPDWAKNVNHIPTEQTALEGVDRFVYRKLNQRSNLLALCDHPDVADEFVFMNDDFMLTRPLSTMPPPPRHGSFVEVFGNMNPDDGPYQQLYHYWMDHPEYEVDVPVVVPEHVPLVVDKRLGDWMRDVWHIGGFPVSCLWANNAHIETVFGYDFVLMKDRHREGWGDQWAVSTVGRAFWQWPVGEKLRRLLDEPSPYER